MYPVVHSGTFFSPLETSHEVETGVIINFIDFEGEFNILYQFCV
jgi:hypothetical protein